MNESINNVLSGMYSINEEFEFYSLEQWRELIEELFRQLQAYKDKEDKLREHLVEQTRIIDKETLHYTFGTDTYYRKMEKRDIYVEIYKILNDKE